MDDSEKKRVNDHLDGITRKEVERLAKTMAKAGQIREHAAKFGIPPLVAGAVAYFSGDREAANFLLTEEVYIRGNDLVAKIRNIIPESQDSPHRADSFMCVECQKSPPRHLLDPVGLRCVDSTVRLGGTPTQCPGVYVERRRPGMGG